MSTILINSVRFQIYSKDHEPAHVHVKKDGAELIINLVDFTVIKNKGFNPRAETNAINIIRENQDMFIRVWRRIHENK
jgi:hypothetical protein